MEADLSGDIQYIQHNVAVFCCAAYDFPLSLQIDADDVITRDEQIYVLIGAHAKCERKIKAQIGLVKGERAAERQEHAKSKKQKAESSKSKEHV